MAEGGGRALSRRALLLGAAVAPMLVSGCVGLVRGRDDPPLPLATRRTGPYRLRIAIFEKRRPRGDLPFHAGVLIDAPEGRILYDPTGFFQHDACQRHADVQFPMTDETVRAFLNREGYGFAPESWRLHLFETEVPAEVASQAHVQAVDRRPAFPMTCARTVASFLSRLPGFAEIQPSFVTARLLAALRARPDLRYETRLAPARTA